jgi:hypothetical protein
LEFSSGGYTKKEAAEMTAIQKLVKNKEWQALRESFLGRWKKEPEALVQELRDYLGPLNEAPTEKIKIVLNYLTGTGFRLGKIAHRQISIFRWDLRDEMEIRIKRGEWYKKR